MFKYIKEMQIALEDVDVNSIEIRKKDQKSPTSKRSVGGRGSRIKMEF
jgi:hypothetical protein